VNDTGQDLFGNPATAVTKIAFQAFQTASAQPTLPQKKILIESLKDFC